ncbi:hypothetical protein EVAR_54574_1 [Eumeta japonica]|uniref:Uncharacterized protein n=1 Tax=Eumeta variegata TaxID=151549 RepID=A0A4C1YCW2_EUMVA|nr:hypothetical protein EVAR_54574_1 [Eumeta japonica]
MRRFSAPQPLLLLYRVPILRHCDAFVTNFIAVEFRALYCRKLYFYEKCRSVTPSRDGRRPDTPQQMQP